jgi:hypothetical protein
MLGSNIRYLSLRSHFPRCEHQIDHDMHPRQGWKGGKHCAFGMMVDGKTRTLRPLPVPC